MKSGQGLAPPGSSTASLPDEGRTNRFISGFSDAIGDRLLILDERDAPILEVLRFAPGLTASTGFEVTLRRRVQRLKHFRHAAFAPTPSVEYAGEERTLALVSPYTPGLRLSEVLAEAQGPAFACALIQQLMPALAALHRYDGGVGHGALTASRIAISAEGRAIVVEHVLGSALERLQLPPARMQGDLGIPAPPTEADAAVRIDARTDFFQLGLVALSLLLGRPPGPEEYPEHLDATLNQALAAWDDVSVDRFGWLRAWLERALQTRARTFSSSDEARDAVGTVPDQAADDIAGRWRGLLRIRSTPAIDRVDVRQERPAPPPIPESMAPEATAPSMETMAPIETEAAPSTDLARDDQVPGVASDVAGSVRERDIPDAEPVTLLRSKNVEAIPLTSSPWTRRATFPTWVGVVLACCAIAEAFVIAVLLRQRWNAQPPVGAAVNIETVVPGAFVVMDGRPIGVTPLQVQVGPDVRSISVAGPPSQAPAPEAIIGSTGQQDTAIGSAEQRAAAGTSRPIPAAPAPQRLGGIRVTSPIALEVFEGDARLGSSATGIVPARAGRRELDLVNSVLGFRSRQVVDIKGGQVVSLVVSPPEGRININAFPWAEVLIDGKSVGETPIGNLAIPLGEHEILFRHPRLGEQRRTALVRADGITRVSANLER